MTAMLAEIDELRAVLGDLPESQVEMLREIKRLRAELSKVTDELFALSQDDGKIERALDRANAEVKKLRAELAKLELQEPVAWYEYNADLNAWFISYEYNPRAKTRPLVFGDILGAPPVKAV
jgi:predicted nuclease with TOPRIM domain